MTDINQKAQEFKDKAVACKIEPVRGSKMDAYVTDDIKADGTSKVHGGQVMTQKEAACMKIPGAVDDTPMSAKLGSWLSENLGAAGRLAGSTAEDIKRIVTSPAVKQAVQDPVGTAKDAAQAVQDAPGNVVRGTQEGFKVYAGIGPK